MSKPIRFKHFVEKNFSYLRKLKLVLFSGVNSLKFKGYRASNTYLTPYLNKCLMVLISPLTYLTYLILIQRGLKLVLEPFYLSIYSILSSNYITNLNLIKNEK